MVEQGFIFWNIVRFKVLNWRYRIKIGLKTICIILGFCNVLTMYVVVSTLWNVMRIPFENSKQGYEFQNRTAKMHATKITKISTTCIILITECNMVVYTLSTEKQT